MVDRRHRHGESLRSPASPPGSAGHRGRTVGRILQRHRFADRSRRRHSRRHRRSSRTSAGRSGYHPAAAVAFVTAQSLLRPESRHRFLGASSPPSPPPCPQVAAADHRHRTAGKRTKRRARHRRSSGPQRSAPREQFKILLPAAQLQVGWFDRWAGRQQGKHQATGHSRMSATAVGRSVAGVCGLRREEQKSAAGAVRKLRKHVTSQCGAVDDHATVSKPDQNKRFSPAG